MRPFVCALPSYLQDTKDTVLSLQEITVTADTYLASLDVESLYTNILHDLGLQAVKYFLSTSSIYFRTHDDLVITLLNFVLTKNDFLFDDKIYHQQRGTAMGTTCAPTFANLFLGWWGKYLVFSEDLVSFTSHVTFWGRYIDDILILWDGDRSLFLDFVAALNDNNIGMHFTSEIHKKSINFLDLTITIQDDGSVHTKVFCKKNFHK